MLVVHLGGDPEEHESGGCGKERRKGVKTIKDAFISSLLLWATGAQPFGDSLRSPVQPGSEISYLEIEKLEFFLFVPSSWPLLDAACPEGMKPPGTSRHIQAALCVG